MATSDATIETTRPSASAVRGARQESSVPSPALAPGAMARARRYVPVPLDELIDNGEPVDDPPPLIELIGFDEPAPPPIDQSRPEPPSRPNLFDALRVTRPQLLARAGASAAPMVEETAEPLAKPATEQIFERVRRLGAMGLLALAQQWWGATAALRAADWRQLASWGRWAAAAAVIITLSYAAGFGLFSRPVHRSIAPLANAPSDPAQRLAYFQRGADAGDPEAELQLAILYAKGEGVTQDYSIAAKWFRAAAEQGVPRAQYDLGVLYERGRGVPTDTAQAATWYRKAADGEYALAQYNLAVAYTKGEGTRKDPAAAASWYRRAAAQGVVQAMVNLGMLYERGEGVPVSPVDAYAWYLAAGRRGNEPAAKRADDLFGVLSPQEQIRGQKLAMDVANSIHDPAPEAPRGG